MKISQSVQELKQAGDLLHLLDYLIVGLAKENSENTTVPWSGIKLNLDQVRQIVLNNVDSLSNIEEETFQDPLETPVMPTLGAPKPKGSVLNRVRKVPAAQSRARDLLNSAGSSQESSDESDAANQ